MRDRLAVTGLLLCSAACFLYVVLDRWWPCATGRRDVCFAHEDDSYDVLLQQSGSWQPHILSTGYVLLALAFVLVALQEARARIPAAVMAVPPAATTLATALPAVLSNPSGDLFRAALGILLVLAPFAGLPVALWCAGRLRLPAVPMVLFAAGYGTTALLLDSMLLAPMLMAGHQSHDTQPWTWLPTTLGCLTLAGVVALDTLTLRRRPRVAPAAGTSIRVPLQRSHPNPVPDPTSSPE